ncbi:hypothetical protein G9A89_021998 [Geosiphon pyriformis]|nr:hypothetical protein G9A89_021998 [Geosiphon pyriformis]
MTTRNMNLPQLADCHAYSNSQSGNQYWNPNHWFSTLNYYSNQNQYQSIYLPMMLPPIYQTLVYQPQYISTTATHNISTTATNSLSTTTINLNTTTKPSYDNI